MTGSDPPRLAVALLQRFLHHNEPLAGDLLERFAARQSRFWFWRQVLLTIVFYRRKRCDEQRPLGLGGHTPFTLVQPARTVEWHRVNLTASPLPDVGGLGLVALGGIVAVARPEVLWFFLPAILGGVALGLTMVMVRDRATISRPPSATRILPRDPEEGERLG